VPEAEPAEGRLPAHRQDKTGLAAGWNTTAGRTGRAAARWTPVRLALGTAKAEQGTETCFLHRTSTSPFPEQPWRRMPSARRRSSLGRRHGSLPPPCSAAPRPSPTSSRAVSAWTHRPPGRFPQGCGPGDLGGRAPESFIPLGGILEPPSARASSARDACAGVCRGWRRPAPVLAHSSYPPHPKP
jgi:hypothetical protein